VQFFGGGGYLVYNAYQPKKEEPKQTTTTTTKTATPSAQKDETAGWKVYSDTDARFSIKYPDNWYYNDFKKYTRDNCKKEPGIVGGIVLSSTEKDLKCVIGVRGPTGKVLADFEVQVLDEEWGDIEVLTQMGGKAEMITIDGVGAAKYITSVGEPGCACTRIYFDKSGRGYYVEFVNKDSKGNHDSVYDNILSTFRFE